MQNIRIVRYDTANRRDRVTAEVFPADQTWKLVFVDGRKTPVLFVRVLCDDLPNGFGWLDTRDVDPDEEPDDLIDARVPRWDELTPEEQAACEAAAEQYARLGHCRILPTEAAP